jgi:hypothetical protein
VVLAVQAVQLLVLRLVATVLLVEPTVEAAVVLTLEEAEVLVVVAQFALSGQALTHQVLHQTNGARSQALILETSKV